MTCKNCGATLRAGALFCGKCGTPNNDSPAPSREAIRARVQGGGRPAPARRAMPAGGAAVLSGKAPLFLIGAGVLWLLQIVYLFVNTLFINMNYGDYSLGSYSFSLFSALKEGGGTFLGVLLLLLCVAGLASLIVPRLLLGRQMPVVTIALAAVTLVLYVVILLSINSAFDDEFFGIKPTLGFFGWMFILNCLLIAALAFLAGRDGDTAAAPARTAPQRRPVPSRTPPTRHAVPQRPRPTLRNVNPQNSPAAREGVTPPDAETIAALRRMAKMHREGLISDEEFDRIKAECVVRGWIRE